MGDDDGDAHLEEMLRIQDEIQAEGLRVDVLKGPTLSAQDEIQAEGLRVDVLKGPTLSAQDEIQAEEDDDDAPIQRKRKRGGESDVRKKKKKSKKKTRALDSSDEGEAEAEAEPENAVEKSAKKKKEKKGKRRGCKYADDAASCSEVDEDDEEGEGDDDDEDQSLDGFIVRDGEENEGAGMGYYPRPMSPPSEDYASDGDENDEDCEGESEKSGDEVASEKSGDEDGGEDEKDVEQNEGEKSGNEDEDDDDEDAGGVEAGRVEAIRDTEDELYNDTRNSNNMSRSLKVVDPASIVTPSETDGQSYCFVSEAEGPMLSSMAKKQILMLLHVLNAPVHRKHVVDAERLTPHFCPTDRTLERLIVSSKREDMLGDRREGIDGRVCDIPLTSVCDYISSSVAQQDGDGDDMDEDEDAGIMVDDELPTHEDAGDGEEAGEDGAAEGAEDADDAENGEGGGKKKKKQKKRGKPGRPKKDKAVVPKITAAQRIAIQNRQAREAAAKRASKLRWLIECPVDVGEIIVSPVPATYLDADGARCKKTFWLVVLRTRRCYDFAGHLGSIIAGDEDIMGRMKKQHQATKSFGNVNEYAMWLGNLVRDVLLFAYKVCPSVSSFLRAQGAVNIDPNKRFGEVASPDTIDAACNIYEAYRAMRAMLGEGSTGIFIGGFDDTSERTCEGDPFNYRRSICRQQDWRNEFNRIRSEQDAYEASLKAAQRIRDAVERESEVKALTEGRETKIHKLPEPIGWPVLGVEGRSGIPMLKLVMQVDIMGSFRYDQEQSFQSSFGELPDRATFELTNMLYKTGALAGVRNENLPKKIFMREPEIISEYERKKRFEPAPNSLDAFYAAGCYSKQFTNVMNVIRSCVDEVAKIDLYNEYMERAQHQFRSLALNGSLHSTHTLYAMGYIDACSNRVCQDLRMLTERVFGDSDVLVTTSDDMEDQAFSEDLLSRDHWRIMCPSTFVCSTWEFEEMRRRYNTHFFLLTPQNMRICSDTALSSIMYRLGQHNGWTYIGMPTVVCDTACKLWVRQFGPNFQQETRKKPSAGLDLGREALDSMRTSHVAYMAGGASVDSDESKITQLKRTTANGIQTGFAMFVNGKLEQAPGESLACDVAAPEGGPDSFEGMNQIMMAIPRDGDHNSELWTTVDKDKTNVRSKAMMKLIQGFSLYLILMAKNFFYEGKTETRYVDLLIVCNVQCSSFPVDLQGLMRKSNGERDAFEEAEDSNDREELRRGVIRAAVNQKDKKKGDKPQDEDQKLWAPLNYFCYWIAGIPVAMMNKMGSWNMLVDYGFKGVSDYLFNYELSTLQFIMSEVDLNNASRYYESYIARCIADTTLKKTFMAMKRAESATEAVFDATRSLSYEAIHLGMLPVVHERLIARMIQYEPLLGMATLGLALDVPVVPMHSLLQFFDGKRVESQEDLNILKSFYATCMAKNMFMTAGSVSGGSVGTQSSPLSPYITTGHDAWDSPSGVLRESFPVSGHGDKKTPQEVLAALVRKLYVLNEKVLNASAHCKQEASFLRCIQSLTRPYDVRGFVGGMSQFSNMRHQVHYAYGNRSHDFPTVPITAGGVGGGVPQNPPQQQQRMGAAQGEGGDRGIDPVVVVAQRGNDVHCLCVHVPSILWWFSVMGRPRRDNGIVVEAAHNLMALALRTIPKTVFPYDVVPMTRLDHVTKEQAILDLRASAWGGQERSHSSIVRFKNGTITSQSFNMECGGRNPSRALEDEMHMRSIFMLAADVKTTWYNVPIHKWRLTLDLAFDVSYPFVRYRNTDQSWRGRTQGHLGASSRSRGHLHACLFMNPTRRSAMLWALPPEDLERFGESSERELASSGWLPACTMLQEFSVAPLRASSTTIRVGCMDEAIECIFAMGFGPCPFYRRAGVLVLGWESHEAEFGGEDDGSSDGKRVGCIVPHHASHGHGCRHCEFRACYMCPQNPFYEVYYGRGAYEAGAPTTRMLPTRACEAVIPVGTKLLLSVHSVELLALSNGARGLQNAALGSRSRRRCAYDASGNPTRVTARESQERAQATRLERGEQGESSQYIYAWVDICRTFSPPDGMAYVTISVMNKNSKNAIDSRGVFVKPADLFPIDSIAPHERAGVKTHVIV